VKIIRAVLFSGVLCMTVVHNGTCTHTLTWAVLTVYCLFCFRFLFCFWPGFVFYVKLGFGVFWLSYVFCLALFFFSTGWEECVQNELFVNLDVNLNLVSQY